MWREAELEVKVQVPRASLVAGPVLGPTGSSGQRTGVLPKGAPGWHADNARGWGGNRQAGDRRGDHGNHDTRSHRSGQGEPGSSEKGSKSRQVLQVSHQAALRNRRHRDAARATDLNTNGFVGDSRKGGAAISSGEEGLREVCRRQCFGGKVVTVCSVAMTS